MPPTPQPGETREQATIKWLTRLLAAAVDQSASERLVIKRESLLKEHEGLDLVESRDEDGNLLLRFDSVKHIAIYPLGGVPSTPSATYSAAQEPLPSQILQTPSVMTTAGAPGPIHPGVSPPKSPDQIRSMEQLIQKQQLAQKIMSERLAQEQRRRQGLEELLEAAQVTGQHKP